MYAEKKRLALSADCQTIFTATLLITPVKSPVGSGERADPAVSINHPRGWLTHPAEAHPNAEACLANV